MSQTTLSDILRRPSDWPLQLTVWGGSVKRGTRFHGTKRQLKKYLREINSVGINGFWDIDRELLPDERL